MPKSTSWELPLGDNAGDLARWRVSHLGQVPGVDAYALAKLTRAYPSLRAIYVAPDRDLARVVGAVAAARIRWFLDAPLT